MPKKTPFHERLEPLNQTGIWKNWSGYLVAPRYQYSVSNEYYAIRNSVALLDTSPLFKYKFTGADAGRLLQHAMVRNIQRCDIGAAQYTAWCDEQGFVLQDGVVLRLGDNEYWLTAAEPSQRYFRQLAKRLGFGDVQVEDISESYGLLALQGPHAYDVLCELGQFSDSVGRLRYFESTVIQMEQVPVVVSRTGFTGDLGYELWVPKEAALRVWDALYEAGRGYNLTPLGTTALKLARLEAGLLLMDVDFQSSRFAWVDAQRETPIELGWSWMLRGLSSDGRAFVGRQSIESEQREQSSRWTTVGLEIDWREYDRVYREAGILPPKHELYSESTMSVYRRNETPWDYAGYASSFAFSPLLQKPIAIAKLPLDLAVPGTEVDLEIQVIRKPATVLARVVKLPFYSPARKTDDVMSGVKR